MFVNEFEKTADIGKALKGVGSSLLEGAKGVGHGVMYQGKRSSEKLKHAIPEFKKNWKGVKNPKSYKALSSLAVKLAPEGAVGYGTYKLLKKVFDPNDQQTATLGYY